MSADMRISSRVNGLLLLLLSFDLLPKLFELGLPLFKLLTERTGARPAYVSVRPRWKGREVPLNILALECAEETLFDYRVLRGHQLPPLNCHHE